MIEKKYCPKCGADLPVNALGGDCPKCLMMIGLEDKAGITPENPPVIEVSHHSEVLGLGRTEAKPCATRAEI